MKKSIILIGLVLLAGCELFNANETECVFEPFTNIHLLTQTIHTADGNSHQIQSICRNDIGCYFGNMPNSEYVSPSPIIGLDNNLTSIPNDMPSNRPCYVIINSSTDEEYKVEYQE